MKWLATLGTRARALGAWARRIPGGWNYAFQDVRLIVDVGGDIHHFYLPAWFQQRFVRGGYVLVGTVLGTVCISALANGYYWHGNAELRSRNRQLVQTQQEVAKALVDSTPTVRATVESAALPPEDLIGLASRIRARGDALQNLSHDVTTDLVELNRVLRVELKDTGLPTSEGARVLGRGGKPVRPDPPSLESAIGDYTQLHGVYAALPAQMPISEFAVSSSFGARIHPITGNADRHPGLDLVPMAGDRVRAVMAGKVEFAGWEGAYGNAVIIRHSARVQTRYAHLNSIALKRGALVSQGQPIGIAGSTGMSTGKHVHFEVLYDGRPVNPLPVVMINNITAKISTANVY